MSIRAAGFIGILGITGMIGLGAFQAFGLFGGSVAKTSSRPAEAGVAEPGRQEELKHKEKMEYLYTNTTFPQTSGG